MKKISLTFTSCILVLVLSAQSIIREQKAFYDTYHFTKEKDWDQLQERLTGIRYRTLPKDASLIRSNACTLMNKRVYGWHPYWNGSTLHNNYQWNLLSDLCYFDYTITPATGANSNVSFAWSTSAAVTAAKNNGVRVSFCATLFSSHATFLTSATAQNIFIQNTLTLLRSRGGKGVCVDFESMPASQKTNFVSFIQALSKKVHDSIPGGEVAVALPAVDWNNVFDIPALNNSVDLFIIMGYDYYYGGSANAGPTDPLYAFETSYTYNVSRSISNYLNLGVPNTKLLLGVPYYGRQYKTAGSTIPSTNSGAANSTTPAYKTVRANVDGSYSAANRKWDANSYSTYYTFQSGGSWYQCFIDDSFSIKKRYDIVNQRGLAGIGIWTLGYDDGYSDLWNMISNAFSSCVVRPCTDSLFDMGGPNRNYNDRESYTYTIAPALASFINLDFSQFDLESNYDSLWLYDGPNTSSPLIGSYTGTHSPGTIKSAASSVTLRFRSDGATNKTGYKAMYTCQVDSLPPSTFITALQWITGNLMAGFNDADVGIGLKHRFYSAEEYTTGSWRGNRSNGFFNDAFDGTTIHPDWTKQSGIWSINSNTLYQSDETNPNTNLYTSLTQNADQLVYHWTQKISGSGNNRRGGLYFMCSAPTGNGRGNSYLVLTRVENGGRLQILRSVNDMVFLNVDTPYPFIPNTSYDLKVVYNKWNGQVAVFINNKFATVWTDTLPLMSGNYISFRSGECTMNVDNLEILKSRPGNTANISVGADASNDIRTQNSTVSVPAARIKSLVMDGVNLFSTEAIKNLNVDYTNPNAISMVRDGITLTDISTTTSTSQLSANWNASSDINSGILKYYYAIGKTPGATDIAGWTDNGKATSVTKSGLVLTIGTTYFFSVKAENGAGLQSTSLNSNGQKVVPKTGPSILQNSPGAELVKGFSAYPDPANNTVNFSYTLDQYASVSISVFDINGNKVRTVLENIPQLAGDHVNQLMRTGLPDGMYYVILNTEKEWKVIKVIFE